jgi:outer membrane protein assembly factor BamB/predicted transcriptional regulator
MKTNLARLCAILIVLCMSIPTLMPFDLLRPVDAAPVTSPWPTFRHDLSHTGRSQYNTSNNNGQQQWAFTTGGPVRSSPAIGSDGTIYVGSNDGKVYALNPNGTKKWDFPTVYAVTSSPAIGPDGTVYFGSIMDKKLYALFPNGTKRWEFLTGDYVYSPPSVGPDGTIYFGSKDHKLYALYPNGTKKWDFLTGNVVDSSPAIGSDGTIYFGGIDFKLYALNPNGTKKWEFATENALRSSPAIGPDGTIYVGSNDGNLYAVYPNGTKKWNFYILGTIESSPAIGADGTIYFGQYYKKIYALFPNGTKKWDYFIGDAFGSYSSPAIGSDGAIYIGSMDSHVYALYPNGTKKWDFQTGDAVTSSPAIGSDGTIYIGSDDSKLYAIGTSLANSPWPMFRHDLSHTGRSQYDTSKNNGKEKWNFTTGDIIWTSPAIGSDGTIYFTSNDYNLYALYTSGTKKWNFTTGNSFFQSPAIGSDGTIYLDSSDGNLYALYPNGNVKWKFAHGDGASNPPVIGPDGTIYITTFSSSDNLYAIYPNGTMKWHFTLPETINSSPAIGTDGTIYIDTMDGNLYALTPDGTKKWNFTTGNAVYTGQNPSPAIGSDGTIYIGSPDRNVYAIYPDGTEKWAFATGDGVFSSPAIGSDGIIYIGSDDNKLYALYPDGTEKWAFTTGSNVTSSPAIGSDGTIYFGSGDYKVYALFPNGTKKWDFTTGNYVYAAPAIGSEGTIYIGSYDCKLYAIGTAALATPPTAPQGLHVTGGNAQINLAWAEPNSDGGSKITNYSIYKGTTSGHEFFLVKLGNALTYQDNNVTNGQKYYYEVTVSNAIGESPRSNEANATPKTIPTAPQNLQGIGGNARVDLTWTAPSDDGGSTITNYSIYIGTISGHKTFLVKVGNVNTYQDNTVTEGHRYYYEVTATNSIGEGPRSNEANVTLFYTGTENTPWPMFRGNPQHTGYSCYNTSNNDGELLWKYHTNGSMDASPTIAADGTIYIGSGDYYLYAIAHNGILKWKYKMENYTQSSVALDKDGNLYFGSQDMSLYSLTPEGTLRWKYQTQGWIESSPVIGNDTVYFGSNGGYRTDDGYLYALGLDGTLKWKSHAGSPFWSAPVLGYDGSIYVAPFNNHLYAFNPNGTMQWNISLSTWKSTPAVGPDWNIYIGSGSNLTAIDRFGRILWNYPLGEQSNDMFGSSPAIGRDGTIYIYSDRGFLYAINANGMLRSMLNLTGYDHYRNESEHFGGHNYGPPSISSDGMIYIDMPFFMIALYPNGTVKWQHLQDDRSNGSTSPTTPAIGQDGTVYFVSGTYDLIALGNPMALPQSASNCRAQPSPPPKNHEPAFFSVPYDTKVVSGRTLKLRVIGIDADTLDDGRLRYSLVQAPDGMAIDKMTGDINWSPRKGDIGKYTVVVGVTDGINTTTTSFNITVKQEPVSGVFATAGTPRGTLIWLLSLFIIVIGVALVGGTEVGVFGMYSFVLLLYTRLKGEKILDNFIRGQLYGMILEWPGSSFSELKRKMKRPTGTVAYHLQALEKEEMIKSVSRGTKKLFFPSTFIVSDEYFTLTDAQRVVYNVVKVNPGISQKGIAKRTGFKTSRINKIIHRLSERGMLDVVKGKSTQCYVQGDQFSIDEKLEPVSD